MSADRIGLNMGLRALQSDLDSADLLSYRTQVEHETEVLPPGHPRNPKSYALKVPTGVVTHTLIVTVERRPEKR